MISFIVPAHNEEALIRRTLSALHASAAALVEPYEIIVANDSSTDSTGAIALEQGARVVAVNRRQIAATRNAGARAAIGDLFIFVDGDTAVTKRAVSAAVRALRAGAVGGGCTVRFDGRVPFYGLVLVHMLSPVSHMVGLAPGCFLFCTRQAYFSAGGFNETLYAGEELDFGHRLKRRGRFVILHEHVITSGRKVRALSAREFLGVATRLALRGPQGLRRREGLEMWYGPRQVLQ